ncbi:MAG: ABC transporter permease [Clostridium sp.]
MLWIMIKKEMMYLKRTNKILILFLVFLFISISSTVMAKYEPEIMKVMAENFQGGIEIITNETNYGYGLSQYFGNLSQLGLLVVLLVSAGSIVSEKTSGTLTYFMNMEFSRWKIVMAKFIALVLIFIGASVISTGVASLYLFLFYGDFNFQLIIMCYALYLSYGVCLISFALFFSSIFKGLTMCTGVIVLMFFSFSILNLIPKVREFLPCNTQMIISGLVNGSSNFNYGVVFVGIVLSIIFLYGTMYKVEKFQY